MRKKEDKIYAKNWEGVVKKKTIERFKKARVRRKISIIFFGVFL